MLLNFGLAPVPKRLRPLSRPTPSERVCGKRTQKNPNFYYSICENSSGTQKQQYFKSKETEAILAFAEDGNVFYNKEIAGRNFISEGAEQRAYHLNEFQVIKTNAAIFYDYWLDYFNSLLLHNYFFPATAYTFVGFKLIDHVLHAAVKQNLK